MVTATVMAMDINMAMAMEVMVNIQTAIMKTLNLFHELKNYLEK